MNNPTVKILLVEDNPADIELTREAFEESDFDNELTVIEDGAEALEYLYECRNQDQQTPEIILLDINLPQVNGLEILQKVKSDEQLRKIPVVILTSSADDMDIFNSYQNYCSGYITKPVNIENFMAVAKKIEGYWFGSVRFPHPKSNPTKEDQSN